MINVYLQLKMKNCKKRNMIFFKYLINVKAYIITYDRYGEADAKFFSPEKLHDFPRIQLQYLQILYQHDEFQNQRGVFEFYEFPLLFCRN